MKRNKFVSSVTQRDHSPIKKIEAARPGPGTYNVNISSTREKTQNVILSQARTVKPRVLIDTRSFKTEAEYLSDAPFNPDSTISPGPGRYNLDIFATDPRSVVKQVTVGLRIKEIPDDTAYTPGPGSYRPMTVFPSCQCPTSSPPRSACSSRASSPRPLATSSAFKTEPTRGSLMFSTTTGHNRGLLMSNPISQRPNSSTRNAPIMVTPK